MLRAMQTQRFLFLHSVPSLVAISLLELVNIQVYIHGPVGGSATILFTWLLVQMIPGLLFGYISDRHYRKLALIVSQALGLVGGSVLAIYGFELWVLYLIAAVFNPMPVARAAFLDNFPNVSTMKLIAITFFAQYIPWSFYNLFTHYSYQVVVSWILCVLLINIILTAFFFQDQYDHSKNKKERAVIKKPIAFTLVAFVLVEMTFYLLWELLEESPSLQSWQGMTNYGTIIGISISMMYNRLPHRSIITLLYSIGAGILLIILTSCLLGKPCQQTYITAMVCFTVIGGLYLPFVTDGVIDMSGCRHKAVASAMIEFGDTVASSLAPLVGIAVHFNTFFVVIISFVLCCTAALLQRRSELVVQS